VVVEDGAGVSAGGLITWVSDGPVSSAGSESPIEVESPYPWLIGRDLPLMAVSSIRRSRLRP
jgi:hypothetical protein